MFTNFAEIIHLVQKTSFVLGAIIYLIFAFIIVKQVSMMSRNVNDKFNGILKLISWLHLAAAAFLALLTFILL